jgi:hypothetical protein
MILPENLFNSIAEYNTFLLYLYSRPSFTIKEVADSFDISYDVFYRQIIIWKNQGIVSFEKLPPELGGTKLKFWFSENGKRKLKEELKKYVEHFEFQKELIDHINKLKRILTKDKFHTLIEEIKVFFRDFFK